MVWNSENVAIRHKFYILIMSETEEEKRALVYQIWWNTVM